MNKAQKEQYKKLVKDLLLAGQNEAEIIIELVLRAPMHFSRTGAIKFINWCKEEK
jgi:hypothetical protein